MLTKNDVHAIRTNLRLSQVQFARLVGVHPLTVSRWERGEVIPDGATARFLEAIRKGLKKNRPAPDVLKETLKAIAAGAAIAGLIILLTSIFGGKK